MKAETLWKKINKENDGKIADLLFNLWERWQDEREYEDINEYLNVIKKSIPEAYKITKRPFGITCKCDDGNLVVNVKRKGSNLLIIGKRKQIGGGEK